MDFDNERDRNAYGYDAGTIVEGEVRWSDSLNRYVIVDDEDVGFDPNAVLQKLDGMKVRFTLVSFEAIENVEKLLAAAQKDHN